MSEKRDQDCANHFSPELVEQDNAELAERVNRTIGQWGVGEGDFYKQISDACARSWASLEEGGVAWAWEPEFNICRGLYKLEDLFIEILESTPQAVNPATTLKAALAGIHYLIESRRIVPKAKELEDAEEKIVGLAMRGLISTASCRREIMAGNAAAAVCEMLYARDAASLIDAIIDGSVDAPAIREGRARIISRDRGTNTSTARRRRKGHDRMSDLRKWKAQGYSEEECVQKALREWRSMNKRRGEHKPIGRKQAVRYINDNWTGPDKFFRSATDS